MSTGNVVILSGARTPMGGFQGELSALSGPELGAAAIGAAIERAGIAANDIGETVMGCVLSAAAKPCYAAGPTEPPRWAAVGDAKSAWGSRPSRRAVV